MAYKAIGWPHKYRCTRCARQFKWDKDRIAHQRKCRKK